MPRKLPHHSSNVVSFLRLQHLDNWTIMPIDKMTESEVAATLRRSKIFLAFSELEGFGLPPVEAALCGNIVIGYTGEGSKEYWSTAAFRAIESGNLRQFVRCVLDSVKEMSDKSYDHRKESTYIADVAKLSTMFSRQSELERLSTFANIAVGVFDDHGSNSSPVDIS